VNEIVGDDVEIVGDDVEIVGDDVELKPITNDFLN